MGVSKGSFTAFLLLAPFIFAAAVQGQGGLAPAPVPTSVIIDQGIAYVLMLVALVLTYLIHCANVSYSYCSF